MQSYGEFGGEVLGVACTAAIAENRILPPLRIAVSQAGSM